MATIDLGKIKMTNRGTWSSATAYVVDDIVQYTDGGTLSTFLAVANSTNQAPASGGTENSSFWKFMAKGTDQIAIAYSAVQTADFTVASSTAYFVDTSGGAITVTLPSSPSDGSFFKIIDYAKSFQTNPLNSEGRKYHAAWCLNLLYLLDLLQYVSSLRRIYRGS